MGNIKGFDVLKFILAYFVIANHCGLRDYSPMAFTFIELAVPCFFIMSGYLLESKLARPNIEWGGYFDKYLKNLLRLYIKWTLIYLPFTIYGLYISEYNIALRIFSVIKGWLLIGENYMSWPLWYLLALIVAVWIIKILYMQKWSVEQITSVSLLLTLIGILLADIKPFDDELPISKKLILKGYFFIFGNVRNGVFTGLGFVSVGMLLAKNKDRLEMVPTYAFILMMGVTLALYHFQVPLAVHILASCIVITFMKFQVSLGKLDKQLRDMSTNIYFMHMIFVGIIRILMPETQFISKFVLASLATTILASLSLYQKNLRKL